MSPLRTLLFMLCLGFMLTACAPQKALTPEQQAMQQAQQQCSADANSIADPPYGSMNPLWDSYFTMCMSKFGYGQEDLRQLWY